MDTCIAIRTMVYKDHTIYFQAGAGIVFDSVPESEYLETMTKMRASLRAVQQAESIYFRKSGVSTTSKSPSVDTDPRGFWAKSQNIDQISNNKRNICRACFLTTTIVSPTTSINTFVSWVPMSRCTEMIKSRSRNVLPLTLS
eukprot:32805_6